jgi:hypothetical protein
MRGSNGRADILIVGGAPIVIGSLAHIAGVDRDVEAGERYPSTVTNLTVIMIAKQIFRTAYRWRASTWKRPPES